TPAPGTCINDTVIKNSTGITLNPGTYCTTNANKNGALDIQNSTVTLNPGTYIFVGPGQLTVNTTSTLSGNGVTLVFTDPVSAPNPNPPASHTPTAMNIDSGATVNLRAPAPDATLGIPGMLIIGNTNIPLDTVFNMKANAVGTGMQGVVYLPTGDFNWSRTP